MSLVTLSQESIDQHGFYVPRYEVRIQGASLSSDVVRDVTQLTYHDDIKTIDNFEMTLNNWDPATRTFKYVGSETTDSLNDGSPRAQLHRLFEPGGKDVEVRMGYMGNLTVMLSGTITTMEPTFPASGAPTLTVRGLNVLQRLRSRQFTTAWTDQTPSQIAENIATLTDPSKGGQKRFPLPIVTDARTKNSLEQTIPYVAQANQYDIDFLLGLARQYGYVVVVLEANKNGTGVEQQRRLYFGPSQGGQGAGLRDVTFVLAWGKTLMEFKPTLTTAKQIRSVTVNGWNRQTKKPIAETVNIDDQQLNLNKDLHDLFQAKDQPREEVVVDEPVFTPAQARERAVAILTDRQKEIVKASGTTVGLPDLRAGRRVQIEGLGSRFSGMYFVTETTHTIGESGYTTRFSARREDAGSGGT